MRRLHADLAAVLDAAITAHAQWAVVVRSLDSGELLFARNANKLMMPASNMKIVTLAAAAQVLGWDHRFVTTLETTGSIANGALDGDLIVRGGGDPTINPRNGRSAAAFDEWADALKAAGIDRINGHIVGEDDLLDDEGLGAGWAWDYLQFGYAAPIGALQYNENVAELSVSPGLSAGAPAVLQLTPGSGLMLLNRAVTTPPGTPESIELRRHPHRPLLEVSGTVPLPGPATLPGTPLRTVARQVAVVNPTHFFVQSLRHGLISRGIPVTGEAIDADELVPPLPGTMHASRRVLARTESPPLREIAGVLMKVSQNQYAETLLKSLGTDAEGVGTVQAGRATVLRVLREWQMDEQALMLFDGSGLSRYNYLTAELLAKVLERMYLDPRHREPFLASLAVAGQEGTVANRLRRTRAQGNARVKTGSISNVRSLSGYLRSRDGELLVFAMIANDFNIPAATVNWITDLAVELLANFTRDPRLAARE